MATYHSITDPDDPRIEAYRSVRDRDLKDRHGGRFVAEGETVIRVLLAGSLYPPESLLVADNRVEAVAGLAAAHDMAVYVAPQAVMEAIVGFPIHRGLLAIGRRPDLIGAADAVLAGGPAMVVGLVGTANHDNMGGVFRNAAAFGAGAVLIDNGCCDPFYRKALRVSVGGVLTVPTARAGSAMGMLDRLIANGYAPLALSPRGTVRLDQVDVTRPLALILGPEGPGLPDEVMARCETVRIDMAGGFDSLNLATTSGIALYELSRRRRGLAAG